MENTPVYSGKLAKICSRVLALSAEKSVATIKERIAEMAQITGGKMPAGMTPLPAAADLDAVRATLAKLGAGARQFQTELVTEQARLQAAISRYDATLSAVAA